MITSRRQLFMYEAPEDGGGEPAPEPVEAVEQVEEAAPDWSGVSREEWEATQQFIASASPFLQNLANDYQQRQYQEQQAYYAQQNQAPALPDWDPFDENVVQAHVQARVQAQLEQALGPYQSILGHVAQETSQRQAEEALENLNSQVGAFDRDAALLIAAPMIDAGNGPDQSLRAAAQYMHELEQRIRADERQLVQQQFQELRTAGGNPGNSSAPGVTATEFDKVPTGPRRYHDAVDRALARRNGSFPVG